MSPGYDQPLSILAVDHRVPPHAAVFGVGTDPSPADIARIIDAKSVIIDGFVRALGRGSPPVGAGVLVDEEHCAPLARRALADGWVCAMPVERSGLAHLELEYGDDFGAHIEAFDPTFSKVLVRYNPAGPAEGNAQSIRALRRLSEWLRATDRRLMCELIVLAEPDQLASVDGDRGRYETELRPALMRLGIADFQAAGIEPDVWKLEGLDRRDDCEMVAAQARSGGRERVGCVVLGRGAGMEKVEHWLRTAAGVPGYVGFAIGRTIWEGPVQDYLAGTLPRSDAADRIATAYLRAVAVYAGQ